MLLVGIWGRAVVVDTNELVDTLTPLAASDMVAERISSWVEAELVRSGLDPGGAAATTDQVLAHPAVGPLLEHLVAQGVEAAASADPDGASLDVASVLLPATDQIVGGLNEAGVPVTADQVQAALSRLDPIVIREPADRPFIGASSPLASNLGAAALLSAVLMLLSATAYVAMSRDRMRAARSLLTRFALGALSFAVLLRIGAWLVDPAGGRAPIRESVALLAGSKWMVPLAMGLASTGAAAVAWMFRPRPGEASRSMPEPAIRQEA